MSYVKVSTVKPNNKCLNCGKELKPHKGPGRPRLYCDTKCRHQYKYQHDFSYRKRHGSIKSHKELKQ